MRFFPQVPVALLAVVAVLATGCKSGGTGGINGDTTTQAPNQAAQQYPSQDPASANVAPVSNASDNTGVPSGAYPQGYEAQHAQNRTARQRSTPQYSPRDDQKYAGQQPAYPDDPRYSSGQLNYAAERDPNAQYYPQAGNGDDYSDYAQPVEYAPQAPPELVEYQQPPCPGDNYVWTPGHWIYDNGEGYYWVPGAWVSAPFQGALWTPGWWSRDNDRYGWRDGHWGRHVGYYGGINYGYGYTGYGYQGGYWNGDHLAYNRAVNNVNTTVVHNVYNYKITNITNNTRVSYNGGRGGVDVKPRPAEIVAMHEPHVAPMSTQMQLIEQAKQNRQNFARVDNGRPAMPVYTRPIQADKNVQPPPAPRMMSQQNAPNRVPPGNAGPGQPRPQNAMQPGQQSQLHPQQPQQGQPQGTPQNSRAGSQPQPVNRGTGEMQQHPEQNQPAPGAAPSGGTTPSPERPGTNHPQTQPAQPQAGSQQTVPQHQQPVLAPRPQPIPAPRPQPAPAQREQPTQPQRPEPAQAQPRPQPQPPPTQPQRPQPPPTQPQRLQPIPPAQTRPHEPQPNGPAPARPAPARPQPQQPRPEPLRPAPSPAPSKPETMRPEPPRQNPGRPAPPRPEPAPIPAPAAPPPHSFAAPAGRPGPQPSESSRQQPGGPSAPAEQASPGHHDQPTQEHRSAPEHDQERRPK